MKVPPQDIDFYDKEEATKFLDAAKKYEPDWHPFFLTAFRTGMRLGELFALKWQHVDFERRIIRVRESFDGKVVGPPKSGKGREIPMSELLYTTLKPLKGKRDELVFPYKKGTKMAR